MFEEVGWHHVDHDQSSMMKLFSHLSGQLLTVSMPDGNMKTITLPKDVFTCLFCLLKIRESLEQFERKIRELKIIK